MGLGVSIPRNDFEAVIVTSKQLEHILEEDFGATSGNGLHQKISETESYWDQDMVKRMRYLGFYIKKTLMF